MKSVNILLVLLLGTSICLDAVVKKGQKTAKVKKDQKKIIPALGAKKIEALPKNQWVTLNLDEQGIAQNSRMTGHQEAKEFKVTQNGIAQLMIFRPEQIKDAKLAKIIIGTHGTYAPKAPGFSDPDNVYFQGVRNFAEQTALHDKVPVLVVSYVWDAANWTSSRIAAGKTLAQLIDTYFSSSNKKIILVSHSHGCNVANIASNYVQFPIELIIHYASPIREQDQQRDCDTNVCRDQLYIPKNFNLLVSFYSLHDFVQIAGGLTTRVWGMVKSVKDTLFGGADLRQYKQAAHKGKIYNISTKINGRYPSHSSVVILSWFVPAILARLDMYANHRDLIVNVDTEGKEGTVMLAINKPFAAADITQANKKVVADEMEFSDAEASKFQELYHQNITDETSVAEKVWDMTANIVKLLDAQTLKATVPATK